MVQKREMIKNHRLSTLLGNTPLGKSTKTGNKRSSKGQRSLWPVQIKLIFCENINTDEKQRSVTSKAVGIKENDNRTTHK
jgi:hypothetical protein